MKPSTRELTVTVKVDGPNRELEAEVCYIIIEWNEIHPYGDTVAYEPKSEFSIVSVEYLTEDLTAEERKQLDDKINEGHYE